MGAVLGGRTPGSVRCFEYVTPIGKRQIRQASDVRIVMGADDEGAVADTVAE